MKVSRRILVVMLCIALCFSMAGMTGCGGGSGSGSDSDTLLIGTGEFNGMFNYILGQSAYDIHISDLVHSYIYDKGPGGELVEGVCEYTPAEVTKDEDGKEITIYTFKVKEGIKFTDGEPLTIDDLIFCWKVLASPAYDGAIPIHTYNIRGVNEYRYDDPDYKDKVAAIEKKAVATKEEIKEAANEMAIADFDDPEYGPEGLIEDLGLKIDPNLKPDSDEYRQAVIDAATEVYATDFAEDFIPDIEDAKKLEMIKDYVSKNMSGGEKVPEISGIERVDDMTATVTADGVDPTLENALAGFPVIPEHYYGEGVTKVDFEPMIKKNGEPLGSGRYIFDKFENGVVSLHANPDYIGGEPNIKNLKLQGMPISDTLTAAVSGTADVVEDVTANPENMEKIEEAGKYSMMIDNNGFGYIGISAKKIPELNTRIGLCHLMNRDLGVKTYYGDLATVLERPITKASWGYPVNDNDRIYDYDVDKAKEFFAKAGYTEKDGKMVNSSGKVLHFDAYTVDQDHPVVPLFNQMKVDLEDMGAEFAIQQIDWTSFNEMYSNGDLMLWAAAYGDGPPDPDPYQYFHSDMIATQNNPFYLDSKRVDELIMKGRSILDQEKRQPIYDELFREIMYTATVMPYYQRMNMFVINPEKVDTDTLIQNPDPFFGFYENIQDLKLKGQ